MTPPEGEQFISKNSSKSLEYISGYVPTCGLSQAMTTTTAKLMGSEPWMQWPRMRKGLVSKQEKKLFLEEERRDAKN